MIESRTLLLILFEDNLEHSFWSNRLLKFLDGIPMQLLGMGNRRKARRLAELVRIIGEPLAPVADGHFFECQSLEPRQAFLKPGPGIVGGARQLVRVQLILVEEIEDHVHVVDTAHYLASISSKDVANRKRLTH